MKTNDDYAAAMALVQYSSKRASPVAGDVAGQAAIWKKNYNTYLGKGTEAQYIQKWNNVYAK